MTLGLLVLAAGRSERFGPEDKLLAPLGGRPLLAVTLASLQDVPAAHRLVVVSSDAVEDLCADAGYATLRVSRGGGQGDTLAAGVRAMEARVDRLVVTLGDMPRVSAEMVGQLLDCPADSPACATLGDVPLPPAVFPAAWLPRLAELTGDRGAGALLRGLPASHRLPLQPDCLVDVDRPKDLGRAQL